MISRVRGTEDLLDLTYYNFFVETAKQHMKNYNFSEIQTPMLEHTNLFVRSLGSETDVVSKEMYVFPQEKGDSLCLRPEATASTVRAYINAGVQVQPWKVYSYGPMFRHERPQKGHWRQFSQFNIECMNSDSILHDIQLIKMLDELFGRALSLQSYVLKINFLGTRDDRSGHKKALLSYLETINDKICETCQVRKDKNTLRIFDCKNPVCQEYYEKAPFLVDHLSEESKNQWEQIQETLSLLSVSYVIDKKLVRGLDYYSHVAFEFTSQDLGAQSAFCGGGRYDLGKELGGKNDVPSVGAAIGIGRVCLLLDQQKERLMLPEKPALHVIVPFTPEQQTLALMLGEELVRNNCSTEILLEGSSVTNMMKKANKLGAKFVLLLGPDEQKNGTVAVKHMLKGETTTVKQSEVVSALK